MSRTLRGDGKRLSAHSHVRPRLSRSPPGGATYPERVDVNPPPMTPLRLAWLHVVAWGFRGAVRLNRLLATPEQRAAWDAEDDEDDEDD